MLLAWISIIIPRWLELSLDKWTWVSISMQGRVENEQLLERKRGEKKWSRRRLAILVGRCFLISPGCNWLRTPLPTRHQCGSCQSETSGQTLVTPSPSFMIIYLRLDIHTNTCIDTHTYTHMHTFPPVSQTQTLTLSHLSGEIITFD